MSESPLDRHMRAGLRPRGRAPVSRTASRSVPRFDMTAPLAFGAGLAFASRTELTEDAGPVADSLPSWGYIPRGGPKEIMAEADPPKLQVVANSASRIFFAGVEIDVGRFPDYGFGARVVSTSGPTGHHFLRWMASNSLSTREYAVRLDREDRSFQPIHAIPGDRTQGLVLANTSGAPNRVVYFRVDGGAFSPYEWPIGDYLKLKVTAGPTVTFVSANGTDDFPYPEIVIEGTAVASGAFLRLYFEAYLGYYFTLGAIGQPALRGHYHLLVDGVYQYKKTVSLWSTSGTIRYYLGRLPLGTTGFRLSFHNSGTNANHSSFTTFDIPISGTEVAFHQSLHDGEIILRT